MCIRDRYGKSSVVWERGDLGTFRDPTRDDLGLPSTIRTVTTFGYATTIHKSQGLEFPNVWVNPGRLTLSHPEDFIDPARAKKDQLSRIYTSASRAKQKLRMLRPPSKLSDAKFDWANYYSSAVELRDPNEDWKNRFLPTVNSKYPTRRPGEIIKGILLKVAKNKPQGLVQANLNKAYAAAPATSVDISLKDAVERGNFAKASEIINKNYNAKLAILAAVASLKSADMVGFETDNAMSIRAALRFLFDSMAASDKTVAPQPVLTPNGISVIPIHYEWRLDQIQARAEAATDVDSYNEVMALEHGSLEREDVGGMAKIKEQVSQGAVPRIRNKGYTLPTEYTNEGPIVGGLSAPLASKNHRIVGNDRTSKDALNLTAKEKVMIDMFTLAKNMSLNSPALKGFVESNIMPRIKQGEFFKYDPSINQLEHSGDSIDLMPGEHFSDSDNAIDSFNMSFFEKHGHEDNWSDDVFKLYVEAKEGLLFGLSRKNFLLALINPKFILGNPITHKDPSRDGWLVEAEGSALSATAGDFAELLPSAESTSAFGSISKAELREDVVAQIDKAEALDRKLRAFQSALFDLRTLMELPLMGIKPLQPEATAEDKEAWQKKLNTKAQETFRKLKRVGAIPDLSLIHI